MNVTFSLEQQEVTALESVAVGRSSVVPEPVASRLLAKGLVQPLDEGGRGVSLQLTPKGLSLIRSSDM